MEGADYYESRLEAIQNFLTDNQASIFAKSLYNLPILHRATLNPNLTMIIAPTDITVMPLAGLLNTESGQRLLSNNISVVPTKKVYPMFTAISGLTYGSGPEDLEKLKITASTVIDGVVVLVASRLIGNLEQLLPQETQSGVFANLTRDAFQAIINQGNLRGRDLLAFCNSNKAVDNKFCRYKDSTGRTIFHYLVKQEFGVDVPSNQNARQKYLELHQTAEFRLRFTTGILFDEGLRQVYKTTRYSMLITQPSIRTNLVDPKQLNVVDIIYGIYRHKVDVYVLAEIYAPYNRESEESRISLVRLLRDVSGTYVCEEDGVRLSIDTNADHYHPEVQNEHIYSHEEPIVTKVIHYTQPYPEILPFLYNQKLRNADLHELFVILDDLYRNSLNYSSQELRVIVRGVKDPHNIIDLVKATSWPESVDFTLRSSLTKLAQDLVAGITTEPEIQVTVRGENVTISERFYSRYLFLSKQKLILILELLLILSGAYVLRKE